MTLLGRHSCEEHLAAQAGYRNAVLFLLQAVISLKDKGGEANINLGLTVCCARGIHILAVFKPPCKPVAYDSLHWKAQTGKGN